jgi:methylamine--corrinoid protein Co-methyltransferase
MLDTWELYIRSIEGKQADETEFSNMTLPTRLYELAAEYDISFNPDEIVPTDPSEIKDVYNAAIDLLLDVGIYNDSTGRIITLRTLWCTHQ